VSYFQTKGGETAVICVSESTVNDAAGTLPKWTAVAPESREPVIVTVVPPEAGPLFGLKLVMTGARGFQGVNCDVGAAHGDWHM